MKTIATLGIVAVITALLIATTAMSTPVSANGGAILFKGFPCTINGVTTTKSHLVITPGGQTNLHCHV